MIGEIISAGANLLGGLFGKSSTEKANEQNIKLQKEFAQQGIQWKVADAKAAGIHPLAALGAQTTAFSPSVVGDTSFGTGIASMGQDIGRAINSTRSQDQRAAAVQKSILDLELQGKQLDNRGKEIENALLASKLATTSQVGSPMPSSGAASNTGLSGQNSSKFTRIQVGPMSTIPASISDAQTFEDRYGEVASSAAGLGILAGDAIRTGYNYLNPYFQRGAAIVGPYLGSPAVYGPQQTIVRGRFNR